MVSVVITMQWYHIYYIYIAANIYVSKTSLRATEKNICQLHGWIYVNCTAIYKKTATDFHVCNHRFVRSMTSFKHLSLNVCISDNRKKNYLQWILSNKEKVPKKFFCLKIIINVSNCSKKITMCWKKNFKNLKLVLNMSRTLDAFSAVSTKITYEGSDGEMEEGGGGRTFTNIKQNLTFTKNIYSPILRI